MNRFLKSSLCLLSALPVVLTGASLRRKKSDKMIGFRF